MQYGHIYKQFTIVLACCFMMSITTMATADNPIPPYSLQLVAEKSNPWAWPQAPNNE